MRVEDLDLRELLEFDPKGGPIRFAGQRAVILDAVALGLLRKELVGTLGLAAARTFLSRFGYVHGWRTAESLKAEIPWDDPAEWRRAGGKLHALQGMVVVEPVPDAHGEGERPFSEAIWRDSCEAEQHLLHLGRADEPACWTLTGFAAGYLSFATGREIVAHEESCVAKGDACCRVVARPRVEWGPEAMPWDEAPLDASLAGPAPAPPHAEGAAAVRRRETPAASEGDPSGIVARSASMTRVLDLARRVARVDSTVLVTGESGVGKERVAEIVHRESARAAGLFVVVNCGVVAEILLESELFGHACGSFTGATDDRIGLFEAAHRGSLFLDEVGEMSLGMQAKLLRALQEKVIRRVGDTRARPVDARVVAATNRDLAREVEAGRFRKDLFYRLAVVEIRIPPLRERPEDVLPIARAILAGLAKRLGRRAATLSPRAADLLQRYPWPGNVRELENALERAVALIDGTRIEATDLPEDVRAGATLRPASVPGRSLADLEKEAILAALAANGGNQARTAAQLGIGTATLYRKLRAWKRTRRRAEP